MAQFTIEELNLIGKFIDISVKAGGYAVAEEAFPVVGKLRQIAAELNAPPAPALEPMPIQDDLPEAAE